MARRPGVVVISERLWRSHFGGDTTAIGRAITLDGQSFTIIGVVPGEFQILYPSDLWTPFVPRRSPEQRRQHYMQVIGRLKPGVTLEQARTDMGSVADGIARVAPDTNKDWGVTIEPLRDGIVGADLRTTSLVLAGVVGFVLLMACANVANLLLARGLGRSHEVAVRAALGGSRWRIIRHLLTESLLLAVMGGASGLALACAAVRAAPPFIPPGTLPQAIVLAFDVRVATVAAALTLGTVLLFGLVPAWQAANVPLAEMTSAGGRGSTRRAGGLRAALVIGEVAAAVLLLWVLAFSVGRRSREFGIRVAIGARTRDVLRLALGGALKMTGAGLAIGLAASAALTRFLGTLLFAVKPTDPVTFAGTAAVLASAALVACTLPAWRAARVDPAVTLRQE